MSSAAAHNFSEPIVEKVASVERVYSVGKILQQARLEQKKQLSELSRQFRISEEYLQCLEEGAIEDKIERVYALGFLRTYAEALGLSSKEIVQQYLREVVPNTSRERSSLPTPVPVEGMPKKRILLLSLLLLTSVIGLWSYLTPKIPAVMDDEQVSLQHLTKSLDSPAEEGSGESGVVEEVALLESQPSTTVSASTSQQPMSLDTFTLEPGKDWTVAAQSYSWVEIKDSSGGTVFTGHLAAGQTKTLPFEEGFTLSTGNAGGIVLLSGDERTMPLGHPGEVLLNYKLHSHHTH